MRRREIRRALLRATLLVGFAVPLHRAVAQTIAMTVTADVTDIQVSIASQQNLQFGAVIPGAPVHIDPKTSSTAGKFVIHGARRAEFSLSFSLPALLQAGTGPHTIPLSFGSTDGCGRNRDQQNQCTAFDPSTGLIDRVRNQNPPNNYYYVWLGATASPAAGQFPGVYSASVTATVAYTGN